jgi:hypothetical protein
LMFAVSAPVKSMKRCAARAGLPPTELFP